MWLNSKALALARIIPWIWFSAMNGGRQQTSRLNTLISLYHLQPGKYSLSPDSARAFPFCLQAYATRKSKWYSLIQRLKVKLINLPLVGDWQWWVGHGYLALVPPKFKGPASHLRLRQGRVPSFGNSEIQVVKVTYIPILSSPRPWTVSWWPGPLPKSLSP